MNQILQSSARVYLKESLQLLPEGHQRVFKRMYSHKDLSKDINAVVDDMPEDKLDWAMEQVERSLAKIKRQAI